MIVGRAESVVAVLPAPGSRLDGADVARGVDDGDDLTPTSLDAIHDSIGMDDELAQRNRLGLGHGATDERELLELVHGHEDPLEQQGRLGGRVASEEVVDGLQVVERRLGPDNAAHFGARNRCFTVSWGTTSPRSMAASPSSSFLRT